MTGTRYVQPIQGLVIDPVTGFRLDPANWTAVRWSTFWQRRVQEGAVKVRETEPAEAETEPAQPAERPKRRRRRGAETAEETS